MAFGKGRMGLMRQRQFADLLRRLLAAGCVALVFALGLFAVSPSLHERLHHDTDQVADDGCAIVLFASGVSVPLAVTAVPPAPVVWCEQLQLSPTEIILSSPRYLLPPELGPPIA